MWRRQPPVHSPLTAGAVGAGLGAMLRGRGAALESARALLRERYGARRVVLTDSGTSALTLALRAMREDRGGAVAVPAFSCYDVGTAWKGAGVRPLLYDLVPETLSPDAASLRRAVVEDGAAAVVVAHLYGIPLDWRRIRKAIRGSQALIVEDAAQGSGCRWRGKRVGSIGDLSVLSFGRGKGWTAGGGGALMAVSERGADALSRAEPRELSPASSARTLIRAVSQWIFARPRLYGLPASLPGLRLGETVYHPPSPPAGASTFSLGALPVTERLLEEETGARQRNARRLLELMGEADGIRAVRVPDEGTAGYLRLPVLAEAGAAERLEEKEAEALGVRGSYPRPLYRVTQIQDSFGREAHSPLAGSERLADSLYTLPTHGLLGEAEVRAMGQVLTGRRNAARGEGAGTARRAPAALRFFALASAVSLVAYLGLSQGVRAFLERASEFLGTVIEFVA